MDRAQHPISNINLDAGHMRSSHHVIPSSKLSSLTMKILYNLFFNLLVTSPSVRNLIGFHIVKIRTVLASGLERYAVSGNDIIRYVSGDKLIKSFCGYCS